MIISTSNMEDHGGEGEALERSDDDDDTLSEEGKHDEVEDEEEDEEEEEDVGAGAKDEERRLLDELEGLEEAEEEEYSGPLLAEEEDDDNEADDVRGEQDDRDVDEDVDDAEQELEHAYNAEAADVEPSRHEEEDDGDIDDTRQGVLDFLTQPPELDAGTPEEQAEFSRELKHFFASRCMDYRPPKFYGENLNLLKLWRTVIRLGAYDYVTANKLWRQVGETFKPPKKCTTVSWSFRIFYEKSLLEYERHMLRGTGYSSDQRNRDCPGTAEGSSGAGHSGPSQPPGRARRDAAVRAMQGWHSQKILENEDADPANSKERSSVPSSSREKQAITGLRKRRNFSIPERSLKAARLTNGPRAHMADDAATRDENGNFGYQLHNSAQRKQTFKQNPTKQVLKSSNHNHANGADIRVADEGPEADWVKINVHKTVDCFEVYALVPGLLQEELRIQCEPGGLLVIIGEPEKLNNPWGVTPFKKVIKLPSPIDANSTSAVITLHGQLFVRVPYGESPS
ncbi:hypothetical protein GOP47_0005317 [Adiantum capillus-veneris]|uniref:Uncharacterized protein n=1 Tax=Adiantum capillus-veneris TaxID=13818 RepID=A0A9D4ZL96_ADICA|nr:hypothetical protein GOP47_0005317 [Adiantum capillus-veneris]